MVLTTTPTIEVRYVGIDTGAAILGANAIVGIDLDCEVLGQASVMLMVNARGTAVVIG